MIRDDENGNPAPKIILGAMQNNIDIKVATYPVNKQQAADGSGSEIHTCTIENFPLQAWVNLIISLYGRTLDVYIDGKLVRTCVLPGPAKVYPDADVKITPNGGFSGYTSNIQYWPDATNPQQAYNIYKGGFGGSYLGNLFNKYRIQVNFINNGNVTGSFEI